MESHTAANLIRRAEALRSELASLERTEAVERLSLRCDDLIQKAQLSEARGRHELLHVLETVVDDLARATRRLAGRHRQQ